LCFCLFSIGISPAFADAAGDSAAKKDSLQIKNLEKMVVFGGLTPLQTVLNAKDFSGKYQDLQSVLQTVSGVTVRSIGGFGHYAEASVRGSSPNQVQVYLDGVPMNGSSGLAVDLSKIPLAALQKIVIYKNAPTIENFGDNAGGIISLTTSGNTEVTAASCEAGSFGYRAGSALFDKKIGQMTHRFSVNYGYADNNYPYINDRGTTLGPNATEDDTLETMDNNYYSSLSSMYSNTWDLARNCELTSQVSATVTDEGIFYFPEADSNDGHIRNTKLYLIESLNSTVGPDLSFRISAQGKTENELLQRFKPFYFYVSPVRHEVDQPFGALDAVVKKQIGPHFEVSGVLRGSYNGFTFDDLYLQDNQTIPRFYRLSGKAGMEADLFMSEKLSARAGGVFRYEIDSTNGKFYYGGFQPGGSSSSKGFPNGFSEISFKPFRGVDILSGVRYSSRSPGFSEKYCIGATFSGNADLRPETRLEYDIGFSINKPAIALSAAFFANRTKDKIVFMMNSLHMFVPQNMDVVTGWGVESDLTFVPCGWISITNNITYIENMINSSAVSNWIGKEEPLLPRFSDDLDVRFFYKKMYAGHSLHIISPYFLGPDNIDKITHSKPELSASIGIVPDRNRHFDLSYRLENYLNVRDYDFPDSPVPGIRHYFVFKCNF
jgi:hypothetical protein